MWNHPLAQVVIILVTFPSHLTAQNLVIQAPWHNEGIGSIL